MAHLLSDSPIGDDRDSKDRHSSPATSLSADSPRSSASVNGSFTTLPGSTVIIDRSASETSTNASETSTNAEQSLSALISPPSHRQLSSEGDNRMLSPNASGSGATRGPQHNQLHTLAQSSRNRSISLASSASDKKFASESRPGHKRTTSITALTLSPRETKSFSMAQRQNSLESLYSEGASDVSRIYYVNKDMVSVFIRLRWMLMVLGLRFSSRKGFSRVLAVVVPLLILGLLLLQIFVTFSYGIRYFSNLAFISDVVFCAKALANYVVGWYITSITYATVLSVFKRNSHSVRDVDSTRKNVHHGTWVLFFLVLVVSAYTVLVGVLTNGYMTSSGSGDMPLVSQTNLKKYPASENESWTLMILITYGSSILTVTISTMVPFIYTVIIHFLDIRFRDILVDVEEKQNYDSQNKGGISNTVSQRGLASSVEPVDPAGFNEFTDRVMVKHKAEVTLLLQTTTEHFSFLVKVDAFFMFLSVVAAVISVIASGSVGNTSYPTVVIVRTLSNMISSVALVWGLRKINRTTETVFKAFISLAGA